MSLSAERYNKVEIPARLLEYHRWYKRWQSERRFQRFRLGYNVPHNHSSVRL